MSWIEEEIVCRGGAVSFRDFMEIALYDPEKGYYSAATPRYGRGGDFLTAPSASRWYAAVLGRLVEGLSGAAGPLSLIDVASGDGSLLARLVERLGGAGRGVIRNVVSVERSGTMRRLQSERLWGSDLDVVVVGDVAESGPPAGAAVIHASELYDALPVHRVVGREEGLAEMWVEVADGDLQWRERPAAEAPIAYLERHGVALRQGQFAELNLEAGPRHRKLLESMNGPGVALVLDYGYEAARLYDPRGRFGGSLACYRRHQLGRDPLLHPGEQDITAHVNWDDLRAAGGVAGWKEVGLWPLAEFLVRSGVEDELRECGLGIEAELDADTVSARQEIKRLLDPEGMGSDLKVLVQATPDLAPAVSSLLELP